jgi:hypothetical protein
MHVHFELQQSKERGFPPYIYLRVVRTCKTGDTTVTRKIIKKLYINNIIELCCQKVHHVQEY